MKNWLNFDVENRTTYEVVRHGWISPCDGTDTSQLFEVIYNFKENKLVLKDLKEFNDQVHTSEHKAVTALEVNGNKVRVGAELAPIIRYFSHIFLEGNDWRYWNAVEMYGDDQGDQKIALAFDNFYKGIVGLEDLE